jgi:hypothetical protein
MWHRAKVIIPVFPANRKTYLWLSSTDGDCKVFVNGKHIPYVVERGEKKGETMDYATGFCEPFSFDITSAVKPDAENEIAIIGTHHTMNELGSGGLNGPGLLYQEKTQ